MSHQNVTPVKLSDSKVAQTTPEAVAGPQRTPSAKKAAPPIVGAIATIVCAVLGIVGAGFHSIDFTAAQTWSIAACVGAYLAGGFGPTVNAVSSLRKGQLNVDLLMILAAIGAAAIGDWIEGVVLLFLFSLSGTLEAFAMYRTTRSIESLIQLRPRDALLFATELLRTSGCRLNRCRSGTWCELSPENASPWMDWCAMVKLGPMKRR